MKCTNCGKKIKMGSNVCPECGEEQKEKEIPISTAIATVLIIIFLTCAVIAAYFAFGKEKLTESNMRKQLINKAGEDIIEMYYDDFNGDGTKEAFAVTGSGSSRNILNGTVWFLSDVRGENIKPDIKGSINGILVENGKKYVSIEIIDENGESCSFICGVDKYGKYYNAPASEKYSNVTQTNGRIMDSKGHEISIEHPEE